MNTVAVILAVVVVAIGFVIAGNVMQGQGEIVDSGNTAQCRIAGGECVAVDACDPAAVLDGEYDVRCPGERVCCGE